MKKTHASIASTFWIIIIIGMIFSLSGCNHEIQGDDIAKKPKNTDFPTVEIENDGLSTKVVPTVKPTIKKPIINPLPMVLDPRKWTQYISPTDLLQSDVMNIGQDDHGTMWFEGRKIYRFFEEKWELYNPGNIPAFKGKAIKSMAVESNGIVWFGTEKNEIVRFNNGIWSSQVVEEGGYRDNEITSIVIRKNGELCAISIEGLSCEINKKEWIHYPFEINSVAQQVYLCKAILTSKDEIIIAASNGLLFKYDGKALVSKTISQWIGAITDSKDGYAWVFTEKGLGKISSTNQIDHFWTPAIIWEFNPVVMNESADGILWLGTGGGYQIAKYVEGKFFTIDNMEINNSEEYRFDSNDFPFKHVNVIFFSNDGAIWFGTVNGIFRFH